MTDLTLRSGSMGAVAVPVTVPTVVEVVAQRLKGSVIYTKVLPTALTNAASAPGVVLVGDGAGGFVFPEFHPAFDGMFATLKLLEDLARFNTRLSEVVDSLPPYHLIRTQVNCPWEYKGPCHAYLERAIPGAARRANRRCEDRSGRGVGARPARC